MTGSTYQSLHKTFQKLPDYPEKNYVPNGSTALFDAIGSTILKLEETIAQTSDLPTIFVIVVLTDGYENSSQMFTLHQIRTLIQRLEATGKWTFSFIGATLDAVDVADQMAFKKQNSYSFQKNAMKADVWDRLSGSIRNYMSKKEKVKISQIYLTKYNEDPSYTRSKFKTGIVHPGTQPIAGCTWREQILCFRTR